MKGHSNNNIKPTSWDSGSGFNVGEGDLLSGFPWPPRSYTCSFCKREFRSAQALGGHMNVHRRDRARQLRQSPPRDNSTTLLNLNVKPNRHNNPLFINPNPSFSSSSPSPKTSPFSKFPPPSAASSVSSASATRELKKRLAKTTALCNHFNLPKDDCLMKKATKQLFGVEDMGCLKHEAKCSTLMKKNAAENIVTLDLEIGLLSGKKQDLDLELRLGCS